MLQVQVLTLWLLMANVTARLLTDLGANETEDNHTTTTAPEGEMEGLRENYIIHMTPIPSEIYNNETEEELGGIVQNKDYEKEEMEDFPDDMIDVSDHLTIDGRTCLIAWDNLILVEEEILEWMIQNRTTNPCKPLKEIELSDSNYSSDKNIELKPGNYTTVKTPCYRSLDPENSDGEAGYCDCNRYTRWKGQRFCCPQCCVHPQLMATDNMFKCACIFSTYSTE